ncbi:GntR family transcriptional regulator [Edaphobacter acidisoli]|uniref:GntR family transcriptional regulator n=2 Tax=Edaphobacter acidisoli TaxID=2040573 RepID=A0A916RE20_9BACT|nr:GntR family transcriptional regulator [Edaphobacter acidisoli]
MKLVLNISIQEAHMVKTRVARHDVREEIQRRILSGESKPGERLSQQSLARELGVAQGTVRESLLELQWLGLVESIDHLGVFVDNLDAPRICEAYLVREVMEGLAARLACRHAGRSDIAELRTMADKIYKLSQEKKDTETASLDRNFHLHITELSQNGTLIRLSQTYRVLGMAVRAYRDPSVIHAEHLRIIEAIEHNFADEAERQARHHVIGAREMIENQAAHGKFVPKWVG